MPYSSINTVDRLFSIGQYRKSSTDHLVGWGITLLAFVWPHDLHCDAIESLVTPHSHDSCMCSDLVHYLEISMGVPAGQNTSLIAFIWTLWMLITDTPFIMKRATLLVTCRKCGYQGTAKNDHYACQNVRLWFMICLRLLITIAKSNVYVVMVYVSGDKMVTRTTWTFRCNRVLSQVVDHHCQVPKTTQVSWQVSLACVLIFELSRCVCLSRQLSEFWYGKWPLRRILYLMVSSGFSGFLLFISIFQ